ncbi:hypothetical protein [Halobacterium sp. CBA1126]|uniref:hypothetical protein n=1 Tax=Halobacterium sp. CBA1126 TaxID=2668074 RepID=UPI00132A038C|nr:hypothetical protein [Halobacterium sp. CBA1126]
MSHDQQPNDIAIDAIPIDLEATQTGDVDLSDVPDDIESITRGLAGEQPPTNPIVVLQAARWWYLHGEGGTDPAFQWAIEWTRHLATGTPSDSERFDAFLAYLVSVGFADDRHELR